MTFLQYVAKDILAKHGVKGLADVAVIFPNKRASLFLNQALYEEAGQPIWSPAYYTISDLFRHHSELTVPDQMSLIFRIYNIYVSLTGSDESLDHFFSWGQLMLSDFDDLDKNLVEADKLFINLEAWQEMRDFSFLSEQQRQSLEEFFGKVTTDTALQKRFNDIWTVLRPLYHAFKDSLRKDGLAYEGMLYRDVVEKGIKTLHYKHYIFVGFNLLQKVEQKLFRELQDKGLAEFYWDFDNYYMKPGHEAGRFIRQYLEKFPNELSPGRASAGIDTDEIYNNLSIPKDITYISAPTEDIQARYVSTWLEDCNHEVLSSKFKVQSKTAIVLADEKLLQNVVHCLPTDVGDVNITTGYPLSASPAATLVYALLNLQLHGLTKDGEHYKIAAINQILRHPYVKFLSDDCQGLYQELNEHKTFYPSRKQLTEGRDEKIAILFRKLEPTTDSNVGIPSGTLPLLPWISDVLKLVGVGSRDTEDPLTHESIFRMYTLILRLDDIMSVSTTGLEGEKDGKQIVSTVVLQRLLSQLIDSTSIPFHGEPALGIQIMGVLETRNLDFDHVLVLSCNEGNLPKGVNDTSFIPHSLRKGFEMTTVENKVAIYSYYFHSLLQRAKDVTLTYNNAADDGKQGEMSRFMLQFMVEKGEKQTIRRMTLQSGQNVTPISRVPIEKTGKVKEVLEDIESLSPTAINRYLRCNLQFYYNIICGLKEQDNDDDDEIDNATFGDIFHRTAELIYIYLSGVHHEHVITAEMIDTLMKDKVKIEQFLDQAFREKFFKIEDNGVNYNIEDNKDKNNKGEENTDSSNHKPQTSNHKPQIRYNGLQLLNRNVLRLYIMRLLRLDKETAPFKIIALEENFYDTITFEANGKERKLRLGGQIDRLDNPGNLTPSPSPSERGDAASQRNGLSSFGGNGNTPPLPEREGLLGERSNRSSSFLRVIDYKTGRPLTSAPPDIDEIFDPKYVDSKHSVYYLQAFLYSAIIRFSRNALNSVNKQQLPVAPALLFIREAGGEGYSPILKLKDKDNGSKKHSGYSTVNDIKDVCQDFNENLKALLSEIFDLDTPLRPTEYVDRCTLCPYRNICGL